MIKPKLDTEQKLFYATLFAEYLNAGAKLEITITYTSPSNMNYRYTVAIWYYDTVSGKVDKLNATYWLGAETKSNLTDRGELRGNGCGFDRAHDAAYRIGLILHGYGLIPKSMVNTPAYVANY